MARFLIYMAIVAAGVSLGGWVVARRIRSLRARRRLVDRYREVFQVPKERLLELHGDFRKQLEVAVEQDGGSTLWMLPSFVLDLPNGTEAGDFYAIDVGGTNLRVMFCRLGEEKGKVEVEERVDMVVPEVRKKGTSRDLFDFIATCLKSFVQKTGRLPSDGARLPVGFCFSFPLDKFSPKSGVLLHWTKGYECEGGIGKDASAMLEEAFDRVGLPAEVHVILNDTIGVLAAGRYEDDRTDIGVILGTGTNAACVGQNLHTAM
ncbi:unnamed protein product [Ostreobium quekettii]|uniref:Phosphotransferase n=1 Tax=Ostreobium quekettii TaxID=121088 RepID=A0A8S1IYD3_9CHLO|nr:unnamed protein product [Ostreobium quekettii]